MGFLNANENEFHGFGNLVILIWNSFRKVLEIFKAVCTNPMLRQALLHTSDSYCLFCVHFNFLLKT